jgi:hypothetical protein
MNNASESSGSVVGGDARQSTGGVAESVAPMKAAVDAANESNQLPVMTDVDVSDPTIPSLRTLDHRGAMETSCCDW